MSNLQTSRDLLKAVYILMAGEGTFDENEGIALIDAFVAEAISREAAAALECVSSSISEVNDDDSLTARLLRRLERRFASANAMLALARKQLELRRMQPAGEANDRS